MGKDKKKSIIVLIVAVLALALLVFVDLFGVAGKFKAKDIRLGLDLRGGASITYEVKGKVSEQDIKDTISKLSKRVESYSTEATVQKEGDKRIAVNIPGVTDETKVFKELNEPGTVEFKLENSDEVLITGDDIKNSSVGTNSESVGAQSYVVNLEFNSKGTQKFAKVTSENVGKNLQIFYNGEMVSNATIQSAITGGKGQISGDFTHDEADKLSTYIRIGALPVKLEVLRSNSVGAQLGSEALKTSLFAGAIGLLLVIIFMICVYRIPGLASGLALMIYTALIVFLLNFLEITLTLPGIAGIILSIGMAVDANCIIFTRIKEEIVAGKSVKSSIRNGFDKAFSAILDGNLTTIVAAIVLGLKGSGTVKGFAYTLGIGVAVSMFTALFITRNILWAFYHLGLNKPGMYSNKFQMKTIDFVKHKVKYFIISGVIIVAGIIAMIVSKADSGEIFAYSLDFVGGTQMEITFDKVDVPSNKKIEKLFSDAAGVAVQVSPIKGENAVLVSMNDLSKDLKKKTAIEKALKDKYKVKAKDIQEETISATVSGEMKENALVAVILATIAMLIYIWARFKKLSFALGSVIPLIHDVFIVLSVYAISQITVGNTFIACLLTLVGYSINATIVIFDRIRESKAAAATDEERARLVNESISQTFTRSINTSLTTFIMVAVLYIMGVTSIKEFTLPLMAGIIAGGYSSVCIAGTVWYLLSKKKTKKA